MKYNFDNIIIRKDSAKWSEMDNKYGTNKLLPFWIADMDFMSAQPIIDALIERASEGVFGYTYRPDSYYQAVCDWFKKRHYWHIEEDWMLHSPGVVTSLNIIIKEMTNPGDKIIIQPPIYPPFYNVITKNKRELVLNPLKIENGKYVMDYDDLQEKIDPSVKMLILCSPHNPVGRVWNKDELIQLGEICLKNNIKIISDEIHADIVFQGNKHIPIASISKELRDNSITCLSPNKTFNIAGLQSSVVVLPREEDYKLFEEVTDLLDIKRNNPFGLVATEIAYRYGEEWLEQLLRYLEENINYTMNFINNRINKIHIFKPEGTYLLWLDFREFGFSKEELYDIIVNKAGIALDFGHRFGSEGFLRLNIACPRSLLKEGLAKIENVVNGK